MHAIITEGTNRSSLGKSDEVLVVGVHVGQLDVYQQQHLKEKDTSFIH